MIATSPDGQFAVVRRGRALSLLAGGAGPVVGQVELDTDDADVAFVGPPSMLLVVARGAGTQKVTLYQPPYLDAVARVDLDRPMRLAGVTGSRAALLATDGKQVAIARIAGRALQLQPLEAPAPIEFAVGLERNQVLLGLLKKLEVWDGVSGRPLVRMALQLPPAPRLLGAAQGHLWATREGSDEVFVYRLSDGRPFRHYAGATVQEVVCHPASPILVLVTPRGLVRLHCFAHSLTVIDAPWVPGTSLALLPSGEEVALLGVPEGMTEPAWRVSLTSAGAASTAADAPSASESRAPVAGAAPAEAPRAPITDDGSAPAPTARGRAWREPLVAAAVDLLRGAEVDLPVVAVDTELGELAHKLGLASPARRALIALYGLYLVGEPAQPIARLAAALGDWTEPLGRGELAAHGLLRRRSGKVALRVAVTEFLDGASQAMPPSKRA